MITFKEGKSYECGDAGISPITIIKRTAKTCLVRNDIGSVWRMRIKSLNDTEIMVDSAVPSKWRGVFTYYAKFEIKEVHE